MAARNRTHPAEQAKAWITFFLALLGFISLAVGGITHFIGVLQRLLLGSFVLILFGAGVLVVINSRLILLRKFGVVLVLASALAWLVWWEIKPPRTWQPIPFRVVRVDAPSARTRGPYFFNLPQPKGSQSRSVILVRQWDNLSRATREATNPIVIYFNPTSPDEVSESYKPGWLATRATPGAISIEEVGSYAAQLQGGDIFHPIQEKLTGLMAKNLTVGQTISLWSNPLQPDEFSLTERETVGGNHGMLAIAAAAILIVGVGCLFARGGWIMSLDKRAMTEAPAQDQGVPIKQTTTRGLLQAIDWYQFESVSAQILRLQGWQVERRGGAEADGGADLLAVKDGRTAVVQCKFWKNNLVTPKTLRELLGTKISEGFTADACILFSLSDCTQAAKEFAAANGIILYAADTLITLIDGFGVSQFSELQNPDVKRCPRCDTLMVLRKGATPFWGCTRYPRCRGTIDIETAN